MHGQTLLRAFAPLPDGGIAAYTSSGLTYYRHPDFLGSSRLASTATPPTSSYGDNAYAPYGESYAQSGTPDLSFTGQNQDTGLGLYDFQFREMNPTQGRWIAPDPAGVSAVNLADPQTLNRYVYVRSSPLIAVDNLGLDTTCITTDIKFLYYVNDQPIYQFTYLCQTTGGGTAGSGGGGVGRGAAGAPGTKNPRCKLSLRQRISLGIQGGLNLYLGSSKVVDGAGEALVGLGLAPETGDASVAVTAAGGYTMVSGGGQAATGTFQLNRAVSGNGGPETTGEQNAAIASGPISGTLVLASGFGPSNAEAAANFESIFSIGTGLVNSPDVSGLIDAGLTYLGVSDSGGCR
jgi:RHS repeat-associated protein